LKIEDGIFGYSEEKILLKNLNFGVDMDSRMAIVGANGAGKTTFLKLLTSIFNGLNFHR
jgi:ATPase subunit of ABC transporter with duplicated ATPase domains